jgi:hypothetical protein
MTLSITVRMPDWACEAVGKAMVENDYPYRKTSLLARAWELGVPVPSMLASFGYYP